MHCLYCVYLTTYAGTKLPKFYVGSSSIKNVENGYKGSVSSKEFRAIWLTELTSHPELFSTQIISKHATREEALLAERDYQLVNNVVRNENFINKALAQPTGFFGMNVAGAANPMFGANRTGETHKGGENISIALKAKYASGELDHQRQESSNRMSRENPSQNPKIMNKLKKKWKATGRGVGESNGMFGKVGKLRGKKLYTNGLETKAFMLNNQPPGWVLGRLKQK